MIDLRPSLIEHEQIVSPIAFTKMKKSRTTERTNNRLEQSNLFAPNTSPSPLRQKNQQVVNISDYEPSTSDCLIVLPRECKMAKRLSLTLTYQGGRVPLHEGLDTQSIDVGEVGAA